MNLVRRFFRVPPRSCFLFGPRGTGKSTWLRNQLPDALYVDLLAPGTYRTLRARPERLRELLAGSPHNRDVVIDEVQRVPEVLTVVHSVLEEPDPPRFVLTGSSARKLRRGGVDLLGGRALNRTLHPFMAAELPAFDLERAVEIGLLPLVTANPDPKDTLQAYTGLYLEQEVEAEGLVRDIGGFARFLEAVSFSHASQLNLAAVARECEVSRRTASGYVAILEDLLLAFRLPVFRRRAQRKTVVHDKLYLFDAGVFRSLRPLGPLDRRAEMEGPALEGLVAQHLRAWAAYSTHDARLFFWRTRAGSEVDFVVYGQPGFWAFEVKNSPRVHRNDLRALRTFRQDYPEAEAALLYRGSERLMIDDILCLPVASFLREIVPDQPLLRPVPKQGSS